VESRSSRSAGRRDWYVWADPGRWCSANNWSVASGSGLDTRPRHRQYYLHNHLAEQPDLNWWNDEVGRLRRHLRFLVRPGSGRLPDRRLQHHHQGRPVAGQPAATEDDDFDVQLFGQRPVYNGTDPSPRRPAALEDVTDGYDPPGFSW